MTTLDRPGENMLPREEEIVIYNHVSKASNEYFVTVNCIGRQPCRTCCPDADPDKPGGLCEHPVPGVHGLLPQVTGSININKFHISPKQEIK